MRDRLGPEHVGEGSQSTTANTTRVAGCYHQLSPGDSRRVDCWHLRSHRGGTGRFDARHRPGPAISTSGSAWRNSTGAAFHGCRSSAEPADTSPYFKTRTSVGPSLGRDT